MVVVVSNNTGCRRSIHVVERWMYETAPGYCRRATHNTFADDGSDRGGKTLKRRVAAVVGWDEKQKGRLTDRVNRRKLSFTLDADDDGQSVFHRSYPPSVSLLAIVGDAHKDLRCVWCVGGGESEVKKDGAVFWF